MSTQKLNKAIARVRTPQSPDTVVIDVEDTGDFLEPLSPEFLANVKIDRVVKLTDGMGLRGTFLGAGASIEMSDTKSGEVKNVPTWRIEVSPDKVARLIGTHQLNDAFSIMPPGTRVRVARLGLIDTRAGRRVTDYIIAVEQPSTTLQLDLPAR